MIFNFNSNPYGELRKFRTCLFPDKIGSTFGIPIILIVVFSVMLATHQYNVWGQSGDSDKKSKNAQSMEKSQSGDSDKKSKNAQSLDKTKSNGKNKCDEICKAFEEENQEESEDKCKDVWCGFCQDVRNPELFPKCRNWVH
ncbi:MAG: hypothetical protein WB511_06990 [Nitrososphaeraceae archaeon]